MILESYFSLEKKRITENEYLEIKNCISGIFERVPFSANDIEQIIKLLVHDKKNVSGQVQFVLLDGIGKTVINQSIENTLIISAFEEYQN